jgi:hypothetical protein
MGSDVRLAIESSCHIHVLGCRGRLVKRESDADSKDAEVKGDSNAMPASEQAGKGFDAAHFVLLDFMNIGGIRFSKVYSRRSFG